jgi:hypothetical protein
VLPFTVILRTLVTQLHDTVMQLEKLGLKLGVVQYEAKDAFLCFVQYVCKVLLTYYLKFPELAASGLT